MRRDVATQCVELGLELRVEHVADHRHSRRPLRHAAEIWVTELSHPAAPALESREDNMYCRWRYRMPFRHTVDQFSLSFCHVLNALR
jgi:hypothetical protein